MPGSRGLMTRKLSRRAFGSSLFEPRAAAHSITVAIQGCRPEVKQTPSRLGDPADHLRQDVEHRHMTTYDACVHHERDLADGYYPKERSVERQLFAQTATPARESSAVATALLFFTSEYSSAANVAPARATASPLPPGTCCSVGAHPFERYLHSRNKIYPGAYQHGGLVREYVAENVPGNHHVELLGPAHELHRRVVHVLMAQLHLRVVARHLRHDIPPQLSSNDEAHRSDFSPQIVCSSRSVLSTVLANRQRKGFSRSTHGAKK